MAFINYTEKQGLDRFAKFDPSISRMRIANYEHVPSFDTVLIHLLMTNPEAAEFAMEHVETARLRALMAETDHLEQWEQGTELREVMKSQVELVKALDGKAAA